MQTERILRVRDVTNRCGLSRSSVDAKAKDPDDDFPNYQHTCGWPKCGHLRVDGSTSFGWCKHPANRITTEGPLGFTPSVSFSGGCARHTGYAETAQETAQD